MKKLINATDAVVAEALRGFEAAHSDIVRVNHDPAYIVRADAPGGTKASSARRKVSATSPSGTVTGAPSDTASTRASATATAACHCGLHHPGCSTGGTPGRSARSFSQATGSGRRSSST